MTLRNILENAERRLAELPILKAARSADLEKLTLDQLVIVRDALAPLSSVPMLTGAARQHELLQIADALERRAASARAAAEKL